MVCLMCGKVRLQDPCEPEEPHRSGRFLSSLLYPSPSRMSLPHSQPAAPTDLDQFLTRDDDIVRIATPPTLC